MAEFSKEYCERKNLENWDFSFEQEFIRLKNNRSKAIICEGFGIKAIAKDEEGTELVLMHNDEEYTFDEVINGL